MADYFLSDVHLQLDEPQRGLRLASLVDTFQPDDQLTVVGDLCDFWFAARQIQLDPMLCPGLRSLAAFRDRGGSITILAGNHDSWLGPFYEQTLGARFVPDSLDLDLNGLRVHLAHGHKLGARSPWKAAMEGKTFLGAFRRLPRPLANSLGSLRTKANARTQEAFDRRGLEIFQAFAKTQAGRFDLIILGHVHLPFDTGESYPRLVVLGGWHKLSSYRKIEAGVLEPVSNPVKTDGSSPLILTEGVVKEDPQPHNPSGI